MQRLGKCIARSLNVSKPSIKNVEDFCQSVANKSYVWTDGLQSYTKVLCEKKCTKQVWIPTVNTMQSIIWTMSIHSIQWSRSSIGFTGECPANTSTDIMLCLHYRRNIREWTHKNSCYWLWKDWEDKLVTFFIRQIRKEDLFKFAIT